MKYIVFSFDDGTIHDKKMIELMNKYSIKGTFNLNSELSNYIWELDGKKIIRPDIHDEIHLYDGHEICCHSCTHPLLTECSTLELQHQIIDDRKNLEKIFNRKVDGFAIPFTDYPVEAIEIIKNSGFKFCRISYVTNDTYHHEDKFNLRSNYLTFNDNLIKSFNEFMNNSLDNDVCIFAGHSYEFFVNDSWDTLEKLFKLIQDDHKVKSITTSEALQVLGK